MVSESIQKQGIISIRFSQESILVMTLKENICSIMTWRLIGFTKIHSYARLASTFPTSKCFTDQEGNVFLLI